MFHLTFNRNFRVVLLNGENHSSLWVRLLIVVNDPLTTGNCILASVTNISPGIKMITQSTHDICTSETHEILAFEKKVNAVHIYSSAEILESVASSRLEFV